MMTLRRTIVLNGQNGPFFLLSVNKCDDENRKMLLLEIIWLYAKRVSITALQIPVLLNEQNIILVVLSRLVLSDVL